MPRSALLLGIRRVYGSLLRGPPAPTPAFLVPVFFWISRTTAPSDGIGRGVLDHEVTSVQAVVSRVDKCFGSMLDAREVDKGESGFRQRRTGRIHARKSQKKGGGEIEPSRSFMSVSVRTGRTDAKLDADPLQAPLSSNVPIPTFRTHTSFGVVANLRLGPRPRPASPP